MVETGNGDPGNRQSGLSERTTGNRTTQSQLPLHCSAVIGWLSAKHATGAAQGWTFSGITRSVHRAQSLHRHDRSGEDTHKE